MIYAEPKFVAAIPTRKCPGRGKACETILNAIRSSPNVWAIVGEGHSLSTFKLYVKRKKVESDYEITSRKDDNGVVRIYARYTVEGK